jgi:hypothetical protein
MVLCFLQLCHLLFFGDEIDEGICKWQHQPAKRDGFWAFNQCRMNIAGFSKTMPVDNLMCEIRSSNFQSCE